MSRIRFAIKNSKFKNLMKFFFKKKKGEKDIAIVDVRIIDQRIKERIQQNWMNKEANHDK
jgi:hypothetical protein